MADPAKEDPKSTLSTDNVKEAIFDHPFCVALTEMVASGQSTYSPSDWRYEWFDNIDSAGDYYVEVMNWARGIVNKEGNFHVVVTRLDTQGDDVTVIEVATAGISSKAKARLVSKVRKDPWSIIAPVISGDVPDKESRKARKTGKKLESGQPLSGKSGKAQPKSRKKVGASSKSKPPAKSAVPVKPKTRKPSATKKTAPKDETVQQKPAAQRRKRAPVKKVTA